MHSIRTAADLDEAAGAYKDTDTVMEEQKYLVEILVKLEPLAVITKIISGGIKMTKAERRFKTIEAAHKIKEILLDCGIYHIYHDPNKKEFKLSVPYIDNEGLRDCGFVTVKYEEPFVIKW